jgi:hypothetical protein
MSRDRTRSHAFVVCALVLLAGCGGGGSAGGGSAGSASSGDASSASNSELDRCALLKDGEIGDAIGPHDRGSTGLSNEYGTQSCRWTATRAQNVEGFPNGWHDAIEVAVFDAAMNSWAREQAKGDPVAGVVPGARYDNTYGELWFDCANGRFCVVKARTASGDRREEIATKLARLVESRLR